MGIAQTVIIDSGVVGPVKGVVKVRQRHLERCTKQGDSPVAEN